MATWPTTLPNPSAAGYSLSPVDQVVRTEMEGGNIRVRRRSAARNDRVAVTWFFTSSQMAAFRSWFDDSAEADGGSAWFTVTLDTGDGSMVSATARFSGVWSAKMVEAGRYWEVSASLEIRNA